MHAPHVPHLLATWIKSFITPLFGTHLNNIDGDLVTDPTKFHKLVGALRCLTMTFPNTCYAVNSVLVYACSSHTSSSYNQVHPLIHYGYSSIISAIYLLQII